MRSIHRLLPAALSAIAALCVFRPALAADPPPSFFGPLPVRLREGLTGAVYLTEPEGADVLPRGKTTLSLKADDGNVSYFLHYNNSNNSVSEDAEVQAVRVAASRGLGKGWDASLTGVFMSRDGGYMDGLINWWHHNILFGFHDPFREGNGNESSFIHLVQHGKTIIDLPDSTASTTLLVLQARKQVAEHMESYRKHPLMLSVRGGLKIPLQSQEQSQYLDSGAVDIFVGGEGAYKLGGRLWLHANIDALYAGTGNVLALTGGDRFLPQAVIAGEYRFSSGTSGIVQIEDAAYPYHLDLPNHPDQRRMTTFGVWRAVSPSSRFYASLSENIFGLQTTSHAPDVMLSAGIQQRL